MQLLMFVYKMEYQLKNPHLCNIEKIKMAQYKKNYVIEHIFTNAKKENLNCLPIPLISR